MNDPLVMEGILGWGNRKNGLEAYGPGGRWEGQGYHADHGDLLGDALDRAGQTEGATLIVVSLPRRCGEDVADLVGAITELVNR